MNVYIEENADQHRWCVHMDQWQVGFRTPDEAEQFVERLIARLNAPHSLDMIASCSLWGHVTDINAQRADNSMPSLGRCAKEA
ncbi:MULTISPECIES: hypothetical protein [Pseudomonas]|uniref:Uncharacterized protein n=1 Tax=Pseudomonas putida TaxID=303 RepID=A0A1B2F2X6_PSEPU|nr:MULTISPECIES: hypothetical protein [Pseudomonas]ANY86564.1 hypothetical protein IEC33019_0990 [Pseudomonas putida]MCL8305146.1 hypothetical protein [Pseudomonas putida]